MGDGRKARLPSCSAAAGRTRDDRVPQLSVAPGRPLGAGKLGASAVAPDRRTSSAPQQAEQCPAAEEKPDEVTEASALADLIELENSGLQVCWPRKRGMR